MIILASSLLTFALKSNWWHDSYTCVTSKHLNMEIHLHTCSYKQRFFSTQPLCCLTVSGVELPMLPRCCLIYISVIILRHILYLIYLCQCPCLLLLFTSYPCDLFLIFILIFIFINRAISLEQYTCFCKFSRVCPTFLGDNVDEESE